MEGINLVPLSLTPFTPTHTQVLAALPELPKDRATSAVIQGPGLLRLEELLIAFDK